MPVVPGRETSAASAAAGTTGQGGPPGVASGDPIACPGIGVASSDLPLHHGIARGDAGCLASLDSLHYHGLLRDSTFRRDYYEIVC